MRTFLYCACPLAGFVPGVRRVFPLITVGGTGKTPHTEALIGELRRDFRVACLSRGYKRRTSGFVLATPESTAKDIGDEPMQIKSKFPDIIVAVDGNRARAIERLSQSEDKPEVIILDDGFQYLRLKAHINIVLVDSTAPFDNHHVLPRGLMREPIEHILRADYVFLTKSDGSPRLRHLKDFIRKHNHRAEIIECCHKPQYLEEVFDRGHRHPLESLKGLKIASISAIANPASFEGFLEDLGGILVLKRHYADHHRYTQQEIIDFINQAKEAGADFIVTTEKDAVRVPKIGRCDVPLYYLRIEIDILSGQESFDQCISRICFL